MSPSGVISTLFGVGGGIMINDAARCCGGGSGDSCVAIAASVRVVVVVVVVIVDAVDVVVVPATCDNDRDGEVVAPAAAGGLSNNRNSGKEPRVYHMMEFLGKGCQVCVRVKGQLLTKKEADD